MGEKRAVIATGLLLACAWMAANVGLTLTNLNQCFAVWHVPLTQRVLVLPLWAWPASGLAIAACLVMIFALWVQTQIETNFKLTHTNMSDDDPFYKPNLKRAPLSVGQPGELLFEFVRASDRKYFRCELRFHGESYG